VNVIASDDHQAASTHNIQTSLVELIVATVSDANLIVQVPVVTQVAFTTIL